MLRTSGRRFYSGPGFNIASYVSRIQDIAKNQSAKGGAKGPKGPRAPRDGAKAQAQGSRPQGQRPPRAQNGQAQAQAQAQGQRTQGQRPQGQRPQGQRPQGQRPQTQRPQVEGQARPQRVQGQQQRSPRPQGQGQQQRTQNQRPVAGTDGSAAPFVSAAAPLPEQHTSRYERRAPARSGRPARPRTGRPKVGRSARGRAAGPQQQAQSLPEGNPLIYSATETIEAVLNNTSSGFIEIDDLSPKSIARDLVQGPTYNARVWSVINNPQSDVSAHINSRVNGEYTSLIVKDEKVAESIARTLNGNHSLNTDHKQFLARVAAGAMPPSQVKQVRM